MCTLVIVLSYVTPLLGRGLALETMLNPFTFFMWLSQVRSLYLVVVVVNYAVNFSLLDWFIFFMSGPFHSRKYGLCFSHFWYGCLFLTSTVFKHLWLVVSLAITSHHLFLWRQISDLLIASVTTLGTYRLSFVKRKLREELTLSFVDILWNRQKLLWLTLKLLLFLFASCQISICHFHSAVQ